LLGPGIRRVRRGRGFSYEDEHGRRIDDHEQVERIRDLAIPPAWEDVWVCSDPFGHLQATGVEIGMFRVGSEQYADEDSGIGLATIRREHVRIEDDAVAFDYPCKGGSHRHLVIEDPMSIELIRTLKRRRSGSPKLLAYREGRSWRDVRSDDINDYLKEHLGDGVSAKDFRTWTATVMAAVKLAADGRDAESRAARKRAINAAVRSVAELLGNTPAVARRSYIDPRVFDRYLSGWTIAGALERIPSLDVVHDRVRTRVERAVVDLLVDNTESPAFEPLAA
jgi:DNA topoisomerase I